MLLKFPRSIRHKIRRLGNPDKSRFPQFISFFLLLYIQFVRFFNLKPEYDVNAELCISKKYKFIFVSLPKVGSRSFITALKVLDPHLVITEESLDKILANITREEYTIVSMVRNPIMRIYSCYCDRIDTSRYDQNRQLFRRIRLARYKGLKKPVTFEQFLSWLNTEEGSDDYADRHWMSQTRLLSTQTTDFDYDFIGKLENLQELVGFLEKNLSVSLDVPHKNKKSYKPDFSEKHIELIRKRYYSDFDNFSYLVNEL